MVGPKSNLAGRTIEDVVVTIPFAKSVQSTSLSVNHGTAHFDDASKCLRWEVGKVPKERSPCLSGGVTLAPGSETPETGPTIMVDFKIVMFSASGLKVTLALSLHFADKLRCKTLSLEQAASSYLTVIILT